MNDYGTTISSTLVGERETDGWKHFLWTVTLTREGRTRDFPYRMGLGHVQTRCGKQIQTMGRYRTMPCTHVTCERVGPRPTPPSLYHVLCSLKADATHGESFASWCDNFGYDRDSIKAREMYFACQQSEDESERFFGSDWPLIQDDEEYV